WQRGQSGTRGGAELAVLDAQRATHDINAKSRQEDLDALELRAPNDGVLLLTANWSGDKPAVGANLFAGTEFGSLPDTSAMEVQIDLPQIEAQGVAAGMAVELHPDGPPGTGDHQRAGLGGQCRHPEEPPGPGPLHLDARAGTCGADRRIRPGSGAEVRRAGVPAARAGAERGQRGGAAARWPQPGAGAQGARVRGAGGGTGHARHCTLTGALGA